MTWQRDARFLRFFDRRAQARRRRPTAQTSCQNLAISLGSAPVAQSLCPGQEKRTIQTLRIYIGNSGLDGYLDSLDNQGSLSDEQLAIYEEELPRP